MATLRKETDRDRTGWRLQFRHRGKRRSLWLGSISRRHAEAMKRHVEELIRADAVNQSPDANTEVWVQGLQDERIRNRFVGWGLIRQNETETDRKTDRLGAFIEAYIDSRSDAKQTTRRNFRQTKKKLVTFFGADQDITAITKGDCQRFRRWLLDQPVMTDANGNVVKKMAEATVAKHIKRCRTFFLAAVDDELIESSPFDGVKTGKDSSGEFFTVTPELSQSVATSMPTTEWKLLWALCRWCGMRVPSEVRRLRWDQVLWDRNRIHFYSPKTNSVRQCPIFPEVLQPLLDARETSAEGSLYVFPDRYRDPRSKDYDSEGFDRYQDYDEQAYKPDTQFRRLIRLAGVEPWPKLFKAARQTRRNELEREHPHHVVNHWLGHDSRTANEHYLRVSDEDFDAAANQKSGGVTGGVIGAPLASHAADGAQKNPVKQSVQGSTLPGMTGQMTPTGSQHGAETRENRHFDGPAVSPAVSCVHGACSGPIRDWAATVSAATAALREQWDQLTADEREAVCPAVAAIELAVCSFASPESREVPNG